MELTEDTDRRLAESVATRMLAEVAAERDVLKATLEQRDAEIAEQDGTLDRLYGEAERDWKLLRDLRAEVSRLREAAEDAASIPCDHYGGRCARCNYDYCEPDKPDGVRCSLCALRAALADGASAAQPEEETR